MKIFFGSCCGVVAGSLPKEGCFGNSSARSPEQVCNNVSKIHTKKPAEKSAGFNHLNISCQKNGPFSSELLTADMFRLLNVFFPSVQLFLHYFVKVLNSMMVL